MKYYRFQSQQLLGNIILMKCQYLKWEKCWQSNSSSPARRTEHVTLTWLHHLFLNLRNMKVKHKIPSCNSKPVSTNPHDPRCLFTRCERLTTTCLLLRELLNVCLVVSVKDDLHVLLTHWHAPLLPRPPWSPVTCFVMTSYAYIWSLSLKPRFWVRSLQICAQLTALFNLALNSVLLSSDRLCLEKSQPQQSKASAVVMCSSHQDGNQTTF